MPNGIYSQAWPIALTTLAVVAVIFLTGGTLYLVYDRLNPAPPPKPLHSQKPLIASLPKAHTPPPTPHIQPQPLPVDPLPVETPEPSRRPQVKTPRPTEPTPTSVLVAPLPATPPSTKPLASSPQEEPPLPTVAAMDPDVAGLDPPVPEEDPPAPEVGDLSISGHVLTETGEPVEGLEVVASATHLFPQDFPMGSLPQDQRTLTDGTGVYEFQGLYDGEYTLRTEPLPPYSSASRTVRAGMDEVTLVVVEARTRSVQGLVKKAKSGEPLAGVAVASTTHTVSTDDSGHFLIAVPLPGNGQGPSILRFSHHGYHEQQVTVPGVNREPGEQVTLQEVSLEPVQGLAAVRGTVESRLGGAPLAGVRVYLVPSTGPGQQDQLTSQEGTFHFPAVAWGTYTLVVAPKAGYQDFTQPDVQVGEYGVEDLEIQLDPVQVGYLTGQMIDSTGQPVRGLTLWLRSVTVRTYTAKAVTSDQTGYFMVDDVPAGELELSTRSAPHLKVTGLTLQPGAAPPVQLPVGWGAHALTGHVVTSEGRPVPGAEITLAWLWSDQGLTSRAIRHSTADATGTFRFTQLGPGHHTVNVSAPGYRRTLVEHEVGPEHPTVRVTLPVRPS